MRQSEYASASETLLVKLARAVSGLKLEPRRLLEWKMEFVLIIGVSIEQSASIVILASFARLIPHVVLTKTADAQDVDAW
mmetsp:Transcript_32930/g.60255  ORF Transcript_32930/g.60255 Transcript_32930/m.60255 type:complete len:80 (+) Transcript_32930:760-999(+)